MCVNDGWYQKLLGRVGVISVDSQSVASNFWVEVKHGPFFLPCIGAAGTFEFDYVRVCCTRLVKYFLATVGLNITIS